MLHQGSCKLADISACPHQAGKRLFVLGAVHEATKNRQIGQFGRSPITRGWCLERSGSKKEGQQHRSSTPADNKQGSSSFQPYRFFDLKSTIRRSTSVYKSCYRHEHLRSTHLACLDPFSRFTRIRQYSEPFQTSRNLQLLHRMHRRLHCRHCRLHVL